MKFLIFYLFSPWFNQNPNQSIAIRNHILIAIDKHFINKTVASTNNPNLSVLAWNNNIDDLDKTVCTHTCWFHPFTNKDINQILHFRTTIYSLDRFNFTYFFLSIINVEDWPAGDSITSLICLYLPNSPHSPLEIQ